MINYIKDLFVRTPTPSSRNTKRIIHVGNIAHNAYYNAKSTDPLEFVNDILMHDYYHYASCPEWLNLGRDGINASELGDDLFPNFFKFDSTKKLRERNFSQGPLHLSTAYLYYKNIADEFSANALWSNLQYQRFKAVYLKSLTPSHFFLSEKKYVKGLQDLNVSNCFLDELEQGYKQERECIQALDLISEITASKLTANSLPLSTSYLDGIETYLKSHLASLLESEQTIETIKVTQNVTNWLKKFTSLRKNSVTIGLESFTENYKPSRFIYDENKEEDISPYLSQLGFFRKLLSTYDYRILYSTHAILGYLTEVRPYAAYEHGTIRTIPFDNNFLGRLTASAFKTAETCFITNADYITALPKLDINESRQIFIPHGFDKTESDLFLKQNKHLHPPENTIKFIAPARHTWKTPEDGNSKGNDLIIYAIHKLVTQGHTNFSVDFITYGEDTGASKDLIHKLGVENQVKWLPSQTRNQLWTRYKESHCVLDQFIIPAIGAIGVEVLSLGTRLINADNGSLKIFFEERPPILQANDIDEIAKQMIHVINDPYDNAKIGISSIKWFTEKHSEKQLKKQFLLGLKKLDEDNNQVNI